MMRTRVSRGYRHAVLCAAGLSVFVLVPYAARGQAPATQEQVVIPERQANANVHMGPSSGQPVLLLVHKGTVLPVLGRRGEWFEVRLSPELRKLGTPMRWYKNEDRGFIHQSAVEVQKGRQ